MCDKENENTLREKEKHGNPYFYILDEPAIKKEALLKK